MVSILYRTHRTLSPASKIHSLYVFDSLSRAARHQVTKQGLTSDLHSEQGNCASFLLKIEGVLDGLFQDMVSSSHPEAKVSLTLDLICTDNVAYGFARAIDSLHWGVDLVLTSQRTLRLDLSTRSCLLRLTSRATEGNY